MPDNFQQLFKMSPELEAVVSSNAEKLGTYISVSFRFVNLLGDSDEVVEGFRVLSESEQESLMFCCVQTMQTIPMDGVESILVTSDSSRFFSFLDSFHQETVKHLEGDDIHHHVGFSAKASHEAMLKSFAEFMLISKAQKAYQIKIGPMYASNFPKHAARIGNVPYQLIEL